MNRSARTALIIGSVWAVAFLLLNMPILIPLGVFPALIGGLVSRVMERTWLVIIIAMAFTQLMVNAGLLVYDLYVNTGFVPYILFVIVLVPLNIMITTLMLTVHHILARIEERRQES